MQNMAMQAAANAAASSASGVAAGAAAGKSVYGCCYAESNSSILGYFSAIFSHFGLIRASFCLYIDSNLFQEPPLLVRTHRPGHLVV